MSDSEWRVLEHGEGQQLEDNLWVVEAPLPNMAMHRRMVVARSRAGGLLLHSAIAMDEAGMQWLESLGEPQVLVVPNGWHRMDAARYKARYPQLRVICPKGSRKRVEQRVAVDQFYSEGLPFEGDDSIQLVDLDGLRRREGVVIVRSDQKVSLVFNDALFNLAHMPGLFGLIYGRLMGNSGGAKVTSIARLFMINDKKAYRAQLEGFASDPNLCRVLVAHGDTIDNDVGAVLKQVASTL